MNESCFGKVFARRSALCFFVICMLFLFGVLRIYSISRSGYNSASANYGRYSLTIGRVRGTIYDCNGIPLNNKKERIIAAVSPTATAVTAISKVLANSSALKGVLKRLESGKPVLCEVPYMIECEGIVCVCVTQTDTSDKSAVPTVGYTDSSGHGISGLEAAFDEILYSEQTVDAVFEIDGNGIVLEGGEISVIGNDTAENGIITTIDSNIQYIAQKSADSIEQGAVVVCEVSTGRIKAVVSRPDFDCTEVAKYLNEGNSPLLNRAFTAYSVGSVFKPCVAAAGIEQGVGNSLFQCNGSTLIENRIFRCHKAEGHGDMSLGEAIKESCNTYFYQFANILGRQAILEKAMAFNFGMPFDVAENFSVAAGVLPDAYSLNTSSAIANLAIGQGKLLLSPISILPLYCAIATDGGYVLPFLVSDKIINGKKQSVKVPKKTFAIKPETAKELREYLKRVVEEGTGRAAAPALCTAAGKTATAQTGRYDENGKEITIGWFCGFFPAENPLYAVIVMIENANGYNAAPVFSKIADGITALHNGQPSSF